LWVGGLSREFFTLLSATVTPAYIDEAGYFTHNTLALQVNLL